MKDTIGKAKSWVFWPSLRILRWLCRLYFRATCRGSDNYPKSGSYIIAINHNSLLDIPIMALAIDRPVYTMAKEGLFRIPGLSWWLKSLGFFPVRRGTGDRQAFDAARAVLARGDVLAMAPEGTRRRPGPERPRAHTGIVRLAQEFGCPVVPVGVAGTRKALPPGARLPRPYKLGVVIGKPVQLEPVDISSKNLDQLQQQADGIMDRIYELSGERFLESESSKSLNCA